MAIRPPCVMLAIMSRMRLGAAGHLQADVEALAQAELRAARRRWSRSATFSARRDADLAGQLQAVLADVGDHDVAGAGVPGDGRGHQADRARRR